MGASGCKPVRSSSGLDEEPEAVESISIGKGVRVHQLEGNNFLGKLDDAARMSYTGRLWRRHSSNAGIQVGGRPTSTRGGSATTTGASSSARSSCYSELSNSVWQQQQQQQPQTPSNPNTRQLLRQHFLSTAPTSSGSALGPQTSSRSLDCAPVQGRHSGSSSPDGAESADPTADASQMDLTTLLLQGFDPSAYEQRLAERRLAKFTGRRQQPSRSIMLTTLTTAGTDGAAPDEAEIPA